ncbi:hypothetical protein T492DRAFT_917057 [Pavlovales sp. CCMP2436]|nr:hypothetical protein T492DRAFT_917057 [Pavlovales sp. CCMP2436]
MGVLLAALTLLACGDLALPAGEPRKWSAAEVTQWIGAIGFEEYRGAFAEAHLTGPKLLLLGKKQLHDQLLIVAPEHRRAILAEIVALDKSRRPNPPAGTDWAPDAGLLANARERLIAAGLPDAAPLRAGPDRPLDSWTVRHVLEWLGEVGLPNLAGTIKRFKIDGRRLSDLDSADKVEAAARGQIEHGHCITLAQEVLTLKSCAGSES